MHKCIKGSLLKVIPESGHISNMEQPEAFNEALLKFIAYVEISLKLTT